MLRHVLSVTRPDLQSLATLTLDWLTQIAARHPYLARLHLESVILSDSLDEIVAFSALQSLTLAGYSNLTDAIYGNIARCVDTQYGRSLTFHRLPLLTSLALWNLTVASSLDPPDAARQGALGRATSLRKLELLAMAWSDEQLASLGRACHYRNSAAGGKAERSQP
jgi:hypothetical protein